MKGYVFFHPFIRRVYLLCWESDGTTSGKVVGIRKLVWVTNSLESIAEAVWHQPPGYSVIQKWGNSQLDWSICLQHTFKNAHFIKNELLFDVSIGSLSIITTFLVSAIEIQFNANILLEKKTAIDNADPSVQRVLVWSFWEYGIVLSLRVLLCHSVGCE